MYVIPVMHIPLHVLYLHGIMQPDCLCRVHIPGGSVGWCRDYVGLNN